MGELLKEVRVPKEEVVRRYDQSGVAPRRKPPDTVLKIGPLRRHHVVAAPLKTSAERGEHGGTLGRKAGIIADGIFGEKNLHRSKGCLSGT
ncbi:hypothetical protein DSECCO2_604640 [anaerobic digester metagenome]